MTSVSHHICVEKHFIYSLYVPILSLEELWLKCKGLSETYFQHHFLKDKDVFMQVYIETSRFSDNFRTTKVIF